MDRPLKARLTGASILVLIAVLLIPELLSGPPKRAPAQAAPPLDLPTNAAAVVRTYTVDLNHPPSEASAVAAPTAAVAADAGTAQEAPQAASIVKAPPPAAAVTSASTAASTPAPAPAATLETALARPQIHAQPGAPAPAASVSHEPARSTAHPSPAATFAPISAKGGWSIQMGSFGNRANADKLARNMRSKGIRVYLSSQGGKHRVRAGPFPDRVTAERVGARLKSQGQSFTVVAP